MATLIVSDQVAASGAIMTNEAIGTNVREPIPARGLEGALVSS